MSQPEKRDIPFHRPSFGPEEINEVVETMKSGWITTGAKTRRFEEDFAAYLGARYAIALNSGTAAMHLALEAAGVREGDEVITVPFTFVATSEVILYCRAKPVYVDCDPRTFNILAERIEEKITPKTKAILPVHFAGQACEMDKIMNIARKHGLKVIEDAAHSFPSLYKGRKIGTIGDMTCFSFYATKTLSVGEGGMLVTDCEEYAEKARLLSLHGMSRDAWNRYGKGGSWRYQILALGRKYNLSDLHAAIGIHQLKKAEKFLAERRRVAKAYQEAFSKTDLLETPLAADFEGHAWHLYVIRLRLEKLRIGRDEFIEAMGRAGIGTSVHFIPLTEHPYFREAFGLRPEDYPNVTETFPRIVSLPVYPSLTGEETDYVCSTVLRILEENRK